MRKILLTLLLLAVIALVASLVIFSGDSQEIQDAKQDMGITQTGDDTQVETSVPTVEPEETQTEEKQLMRVEHISGDEALSFDQISNLLITETDALEIQGDVELSGVEEIEVQFSNATSEFPGDTYVLQQFNSGDSRFLYRASSRFQVFDYGMNEYVFTTNLGSTRVIIEKPLETDESGPDEEIILGTENDIISLDLPTSSAYGEPIKLGEQNFTYSGIKGIEIVKESPQLFSCDNLTNFLSNRVDGWYYWNTCRPIDSEEIAYSYNVLSLSGGEGKYLYQRHYVDPKTGLYAVYDIETGDGVTQENIAEKNAELREEDFPGVAIVDTLLNDIINQNR